VTFADRIELAKSHEKEVQHRLRDAGWVCDGFGQGFWCRPVRENIQRFQTGLRYVPDIVAIKGDLLCLIDAKAEASNTPNHSVEQASVLAHRDMERLFGVRIYYVWHDFSVAPGPDWLLNHSFRKPEHIGSRVGTNGSGTPFFLTPKASQLPFEQIFGRMAA
jgi:hypothetical protein